jgi:hypothetical protein
MAKGIVLGLFFGALIGAAGVRLIDRTQGKKLEEVAAKVGEEATRPKAGTEERERLEKSLADARTETRALEQKLAGLEAKLAAGAEKTVAAPKSGRWKELGAAFFKMKDSLKGEDSGNSPEAQQAIMELLGILGKLAKEYGVGMDEIAGCPDAIPAFLLSILDAAGVKPDAAQQAAIDAAMASGQDSWKDYLAKRESLTAYERKRALLDLQGNTTDKLRDAIGGDGRAVADDMEIFDANFNFGGTTRGFGGDASTVAESLKGSWAKDLGLDESQKPALGLVVDEYMRGLQEANADFARREAAGQKVTQRQREAAQLDSMIRAQKQLGETVRLSEAQAKALKDWGTVYSVNVDPGR